MKNITFKKKRRISKGQIAAICTGSAVLLLGLICVAVFGIPKIIEAINAPDEQKNYTFETEGFETVSDVKSLNGVMAVFTDSATGKKGLMSFDGEVTEKAEHSKFTVRADGETWREYKYIVETPVSEYLLLADAESGTVTSRQFHDAEKPEKIPCWNETANHLAWVDDKGYAGELEAKDAAHLSNDLLYPVATSLEKGAKYGYVTRSLKLEIATIYENAMDFSDGLAAVKRNGKWGYIDDEGKKILEYTYESCTDADAMGKDCAFPFSGGVAPVKQNGKYGIIAKTGETVVDFSYSRILPGKDGKFIACKEGVWGVITIDEELLKAVVPTTVPPATTTVAPAVLKGQYVVNTSRDPLNMRKSADSSSEVVAQVPKGSVITVTKSIDGWAYATYGRYTGWVSSAFLEKYEAPATTLPSTSQSQTNSTTAAQ